jgi:DNA-directed RNA polymerase specialized sigma24 family protein
MDALDLDRRFRAGDEAAIRTVYERYGGAMFAVAMSILGDRDLATDCVQQAFVTASRAGASLEPGPELRPWLATITRHAAIGVDPTRSVVPLASGRTSETFEVRAALDALPGDERELVRLSHQEQMSHTEIAEKLGIPVATVTSMSHRVHRRLASLLAR